MSTTTRTTRTTRATALATALLAIGAGPAAAAAGLTVIGTGTTEVPSAGPATYSGDASGTPFGGRFTGVLAATDGTLPELGSCEPATATLRVEDSARRYVGLRAEGQVCAVLTGFGTLQAFDGRFRVEDTAVRRLRRTEGVMQVRLTPSADLSDVYATAT